MKEKKIENMMFEDIKAAGLCEIASDDFDVTYAKSLIGDEKRIEKFRKRIIVDFNKSKNIPILLSNLRVLAIAKGNDVYRLLSVDNDLSFSDLLDIAHSLGIDFEVARRRDWEMGADASLRS